MWISNFINAYKNKLGNQFFSDEFIAILADKLEQDFFRKTKINIRETNEKIYLTMIPSYFGYGHQHPESELKGFLGIIIHTVTASIKWRSKKGLLIHPWDTNIDEADVEFWFEDLEVKSILKEYLKKVPSLPFETKQFSFELELDFFFMDAAYLVITHSGLEISEKSKINLAFSKAIEDYNQNSELKNRKNGLIHSSELKQLTMDGVLIFYIDLGSSGEMGLNYLLNFLNRYELIEKIKITSFPN